MENNKARLFIIYGDGVFSLKNEIVNQGGHFSSRLGMFIAYDLDKKQNFLRLIKILGLYVRPATKKEIEINETKTSKVRKKEKKNVEC